MGMGMGAIAARLGFNGWVGGSGGCEESSSEVDVDGLGAHARAGLLRRDGCMSDAYLTYTEDALNLNLSEPRPILGLTTIPRCICCQHVLRITN